MTLRPSIRSPPRYGKIS